MHVEAAVNVLLEGSELSVHRAGLFAYRRYYNYPMRRFKDYNLVLFARGQAVWLIEGVGEAAVRPGTVLLLPPGVANGTPGRQSGQAEHASIHFDLHIESGTDFFQNVPFDMASRPDGWEALYALARRVAEEWTGYELLGRSMVVHDLTRTLLVDLIRRSVRRPGITITTDPRVLEVLANLHERFAEPLTVDEMGEWVGLSASHLRSLFAAELGVSPIAALQTQRTREARRLLAGGSLTVKEIARQVGYEDPLYFSRAFRKRVGMSPMEYRQSAKNP